MLREYIDPDLQEIAEALGHKYRWRIVPAGPTALLVQAVSAIGHGNLDDRQKAHLSRLFKPEEFRRIVKETVSATAWVHEYIKDIAQLAQSGETER